MKFYSASQHPSFFRPLATLTCVLGGLLPVFHASGQVLFTENFNDGLGSTRWTVSESSGVNASNFAYDYSTVGIPAAPSGTGTTGLRLDSNLGPTGASSAILAFPNGQNFSTPITLSFDLWLNVAGSATTEFAIFGVGHTSTATQVPNTATPGTGPVNHGIHYAMTGDNGAARDARVYVDGAEQTGTAGGFAGGTAQATQNPPYSEAYLGAIPGNQWLQVEMTALADRTIFSVNGNIWAETLTTPGTGNIMVGYMDIFTSVAPNTVFAVYDNVVVAVPEPAVFGVAAGLAVFLLPVLRRRFQRSHKA